MKKLRFILTLILGTCLMQSHVAKAQPMCDAGFTFTIGTVTPNGAQVDFTDSSFAVGTIVSYSWSFGNGTGSSSQNPIAYLNPGNNYVCLTIVSVYQNQTCTSTECDTIVIGTPPPFCNANFTYFVSPQGVTFAGPTGANVSWTWDFGDGTSATGVNPSHAFNGSGPYLVCLTVVDANGVTCTSCQSVTPSGGGGCQAYFTSLSTPGSTLVAFTDQSQGGGSYSWSFGDGSVSTLQNPVHNYNSLGWYNVCLTIADPITGCTDTYCDSVQVVGSVVCDATFGYQASPAATVFNATTTNAVSYTWDFGDGNTGSGGPFYTYVYANPGTYNVCLTVTTANGTSCTSCNSVIVPGGAGCSSNFAIYPDSLLPHTYYAYNLATGVGPLTYIWSWGDGTSSNTAYPSHTYAQSGMYTICLTITDATGCSSNTCYQWQLLRLASSAPVTINVIPGTTGINDPVFNSMSVYPNPATDLINTSFTLAKSTEVSLKVMNVAGQVVYTSPSATYEAGSHEIKMDASALPKGMYMVEIQSDTYRSHQKVVIQ